MKMLKDLVRLDQRVDNLEKHFGQAEKDLKEIRTSTEKVSKSGERITELEFGENTSNGNNLGQIKTDGITLIDQAHK